jgi:hypothetical protein
VQLDRLASGQPPGDDAERTAERTRH